ncbi:uncharacterized protein [Penaeus vannamei]|uniref:Putative F-box only protein 22-like isoform X1 n=1 Tax=Penaeus vannamei TaxID=6689 RepID=A0A423TRS0_PENVA|nr:putative F-box only protein 22-like isoform X1 [Penaeus vannamei]
MTEVTPAECAISSYNRIGDILSGSWELTQRIFENLSFREVARLRAVCRTWADVGAKILEKRRRLHYLTIHPHSIPTTEGKVTIGELSPSSLFEGFFEHIVSRPRYCIGFCNEDWLSRTDIFSKKGENGKLTLAQYLHGSLPKTCEFGLFSATGIIGTVENNYQGHWLESANNLNHIILSFLHDEEKDGQKAKRSCRRRSSDEIQSREDLAESASPVVSDQSASASSNNSSQASAASAKEEANVKRSRVGYSIEVEARWSTSLRQADAVSLLLIPHHPGVKLKFFSISMESFLKRFRSGRALNDVTVSPEEFNKMTSMTPEDDLKALLLFDLGADEETFTDAFLQAALERQNYQLAIGGGVVESLQCGDKNNGELTSLGVAISGPNVMAASVVISKYVSSPKGLESYMKQLKSCGLPEDQSLAFMFTCCGRGYSWYRRRGNPWFDYHNVETKAFRQAFPNTPIFGFFGGGEIGLCHFPKFNSTEADEDVGVRYKKRKKKKLFHQFSTIIVLLSFL